MKAIVAVDKNWGIGHEGKLLERVPEDMGFLKNITMGKVVVMGRATFESLPGMKPLKGRTNIVLSTNRNYDQPGILVCKSLEEFFKTASGYPAEDIFLLGGARVYYELLPYCSEAYVTKFKNTHPADCFFPDLDSDCTWTPEFIARDLEHNHLHYSRIQYTHSKILQFP